MNFVDSEITLSKDKDRNILEVDDVFYKIEYLTGKREKNKGGNSYVFKLIDPNTSVEYAIKFSKFPRISRKKNIQRNNRFQQEINALHEAKKKSFENVIEIIFDGVKRIGKYNFMYYVMEKADSDLNGFLRSDTLAFNQKCVLCYEILRGINELHSMKLYHRDIKPDNIFFVGGKWKVGDLGLGRYINQRSLDNKNEPIGPYGWLSPEVMNKILCEGTPMEKFHDCLIDVKSDIFQIGNVIWFIFNGNVPIGQIKRSDFLVNDVSMFKYINKMLQYKKNDRGELRHHIMAFQNYIS